MPKYYVFLMITGRTQVKLSTEHYDAKEALAVDAWVIEAADKEEALDKAFINMYNGLRNLQEQITQQRFSMNHTTSKKVTYDADQRAHFQVTCSCNQLAVGTDSRTAADKYAQEHVSVMASSEARAITEQQKLNLDKLDVRELVTASSPSMRYETIELDASHYKAVEQEIDAHPEWCSPRCPTFLPEEYRSARKRYTREYVQHDYDLCHICR